MHQKRAALTETLGKAVEVDTTDHPKPVIGSSGNWDEDATGQAKRKPSKKYIPVYHVELVRDRLVREALNLPRRAELIGRNAQGLAELSSLLITETRPLLRVQAYFRAKALSPADEIIEEGKFLAVLVIKPVKRSTRNPHGLIVIEYRQSSFEKKSEGS
jgi:hypothetical protein